MLLIGGIKTWKSSGALAKSIWQAVALQWIFFKDLNVSLCLINPLYFFQTLDLRDLCLKVL